MNRPNSLLIILLLCQYIHHGFSESSTTPTLNKSDTPKDPRGLFSPRMDYDQWTPLGQGDPLKNDPTYDYVPPVLDRVHYWLDPKQTDQPIPTEKKTEVLLLGVSSKKPSTVSAPPKLIESRRDTFDPFMKFVDGPKYHSNRVKYSGSFLFPPYYHLKTKFDPGYDKDEKVLYTMLMPPPIQNTPLENYGNNITFPEVTTVSPISISTGKLIFQSSSTVQDFSKFGATKPSYVIHHHYVKPSLPLSPLPPYRYKDTPFSFPTTRSPPDAPTPLLQNYLSEESKINEQIVTIPTTTTSTTTTTTTTTESSSLLTTDPLFAHYNQPATPIRGPMYLIIQGHSKVKTYGSKPSIHGIPIIQESNDIETKEFQKDDRDNNDRKLRISKDLQSLQHILKTGQGAIDLETIEKDVKRRRKRSQDVKETELWGQYKVRNRVELTTETYRKGIVESSDIVALRGNLTRTH